MKTKKYKILVLSDLTNSTETTLKSAISFAKILDAEIDFFYVKKPTEIIDRENQLSAMRTIGVTHVATNKKIQKIINAISKTYNAKINSTFSFGNVRAEISNYILESKPDILVLGKRKSNPIKFNGDGIIELVLKQFKGPILIASDKNALMPNKDISLGAYSNIDESFNVDFAQDLINQSKSPLKVFRIAKSSENVAHALNQPETKIIEYVFDHNDNVMNNLSKYLVKNNINLFCLNRVNNDFKSKSKGIRDLIDKLNVSLLVCNNQKVLLN